MDNVYTLDKKKIEGCVCDEAIKTQASTIKFVDVDVFICKPQIQASNLETLILIFTGEFEPVIYTGACIGENVRKTLEELRSLKSVLCVNKKGRKKCKNAHLAIATVCQQLGIEYTWTN